MAELDQFVQVDDAHQRVRRRLQQQERGRLRQGLGDGRVIALVDIDQVDQALAGTGIEQALRAPVAIVRHDDALASRQVLPQQIQRRQARRGHDRAFAAFEVGDDVGDHLARRIARARIVVGPLLAEAFEGIVRRQVDRRHDRAVRRIGIDTDIDGARRGGSGLEIVLGHFFQANEVRTISDTSLISFRKASWP